MGAHNLENAAAAIAATRALGFSQNEIEKALSNFEGMPHRLEYLGDIQDVGWFNDSKATNVESTITAVKSFENGIHLILGGLGKGASYAPLVENCRGRVKFVYVIGEDAPNIQNAFEEQFPVINAGTLERAVNEATQRASKGDVIVLAPACASYDQYPNYVARGNHFKQLFHDYQVKSHA